MAIAPTGAIYKSLSFDGEDSRNYGVYITGEAVYNAPERDVEMITIPGRNGSFALDNGRFENIEVSYPAGIFAENEADFRQAISDFRNFLCSRKGYVRLQDEYNPDEYRMAVYKSGLEVDPAMLRAGEFTITFDCKPQRWLTSGETKQTIASSGDTITNPTLFDARPMIETYGYGSLMVNGHNISFDAEPYGLIQLLPTKQVSQIGATDTITYSLDFNQHMVNIGDVLTANRALYGLYTDRYGCLYGTTHFVNNSPYIVGIASIDQTTGITNLSMGYFRRDNGSIGATYAVVMNPATFIAGTPSTVTGSATINVPMKDSNDSVVGSVDFSLNLSFAYDGNKTITATFTRTISNDTLGAWSLGEDGGSDFKIQTAEVKADSTATILGNPTYIDCDLGICYKFEDNTLIDLNRYIDLGSEMPFLKPGSNTITFDNTFTKIQIVPRWWKI